MRYKKKPKGSDKTGWCTCLGSKVCSEYANTYRDGTHIKFINNPRTNEIAENVNVCCAITMEPDDVLDLIRQLREIIESD